MTRRFEFIGGNSAKFWQISVTGSEVSVHFGRMGSDGQIQTKQFADVAAANKHAEKVIGEKTAKGYREVAAV